MLHVMAMYQTESDRTSTSGENVVSGPKAKEKVKMASPSDKCFRLVLEPVTVYLVGLLPIPSGAPSILDKTICTIVKSSGGQQYLF